MCKKILATLIIGYHSITLSAQGISKIENDLTGGSKKRWVFNKSQLSMGYRIQPLSDCKFAFIIFDKTNKTYFAQTCGSNQNIKNAYLIIEKGPEEYFMVIDKINYEILVYKEKINGKDKEVLLLRIPGIIKIQETTEYYYYAER